MNRKIVFKTSGVLFLIDAALMLLPGLVSLIYHEIHVFTAFVSVAGFSAVLGALLFFLIKPESKVIYVKEGIAIVAIAWVSLSLIGAVPFVVSGDIPHYIDALFETVSGFTTTGASILSDVEHLSHGALFWRSFSHWVGGMGVLVFMMAIVSNITERSMHIIRAEMPGPQVGKLLPKIKDTAKILYLIYIVLTILEFIFLLFGGMPVFESLLSSLGTAGTGGFGFVNDSMGSFSLYIRMVIAVFMLLFGVNFNLYYLLILGKFKSILKSTELRTYLLIVLISTLIIGFNIKTIYSSFSVAMGHSFFQVASIITTTGFSTADFNTWPELSKGLLFLLMFIGGCAGSTSGGLKMSRAIMLIKLVIGELKHTVHPKCVTAIEFEGKNVDRETLNSVLIYFAFYCLVLMVVFFCLCFDIHTNFEADVTAAVSCFNNIGPGLGQIGPASCYAIYSPFSKIVLCFAMLLGRLEIFPLVIAFSPTTWRKKHF